MAKEVLALEAAIILHKKGDQMSCKNYCGIMLLACTYKVLSNIGYRRLLLHAQKEVRTLLERTRKNNTTRIRGQLYQSMKEMNAPRELIGISVKLSSCVKSIVTRQKCYDKTNGGDSMITRTNSSACS